MRKPKEFHCRDDIKLSNNGKKRLTRSAATKNNIFFQITAPSFEREQCTEEDSFPIALIHARTILVGLSFTNI